MIWIGEGVLILFLFFFFHVVILVLILPQPQTNKNRITLREERREHGPNINKHVRRMGSFFEQF